MKETSAKTIIVLGILLGTLLTAGAYAQTQSPAPPEEMSAWQIRRIMASAAEYGVARYTGLALHYYKLDPGSIQLTSTELALTATNTKGSTVQLRIDSRDSGPFSAVCNSALCYLQGPARKSVFGMRGEKDRKEYYIHFGEVPSSASHPVCSQAQNQDECMHAAERFARAINALRTHTLNSAAATDFHQQAATWRSLASKPPLSESATIHRLLAEDAVKRQKPDDALNHYELGVEADPTWATGWYNAAVVAAELGYYADAAHHLQNYLELMPESSEAQAARENLAIWKYKASRAAK